MKTKLLIPLLPERQMLVCIESYHSGGSGICIFAPRGHKISSGDYQDLPEKIKNYFKPVDDGHYIFQVNTYRPGKLQCTIHYPLSTPCHFDIDVPEGIFDVTGILGQYCEKYRQIYQEESDAMTECIQPNPVLINRGTSDGPWGIWGHELGDLVIQGMRIDLLTDRLEVSVGS